MSPSPRRAVLVMAVAVAVLLVAGVVTLVVRSGREDDDAAARSAAERYLRVLSGDEADADELAALVSVGDTAALDRADSLLARASERIDEASLGAAREVSTARTTSDLVFDRFEEFEVRYLLAGERHHATITLGLPRSGPDGHWLVVTPLSAEVDWSAAAWGAALLDVVVGDIEVTEAGRRSREPRPELVHPGVYPLRASVGTHFTSAETDLVVVAGPDAIPLPTFDLTPTPEGTTALTRQVLAAFDPCRRGTAYCPVTRLVPSADSDDLADGWWQGLSREPAIAIDGTTVRLSDGEFRYASPAGTRAVRFGGTGRLTVDPSTGELGVHLPLELARR